MPRQNAKPSIDKVVYTFKKRPAVQIDIVPIAIRLLTPVNIARTTAPHRTDFYRIIWFQAGDPTHSVDLKPIKITSPSFIFLHKDKIHQFDVNTPHDGKVLIFTDSFFVTSASSRDLLSQSPLFNGAEPIVIRPSDTHLESILTAIEAEIHNENETLKKELLHSLLTTFLLSAQRLLQPSPLKSNDPSRDSSLVSDFLGLVEKHFSQHYSIAHYAGLLNVSVNILNQAVIKAKGQTAKEALRERILLEAKRLLAYSQLNVKEVGFELGFDQPTNFIKFFHHNTGQTPTKFQKGKK